MALLIALLKGCIIPTFVTSYFQATNSAAAEAQKGLYLRSYPYRRYNKLILVSFEPCESLVSEK